MFRTRECVLTLLLAMPLAAQAFDPELTLENDQWRRGSDWPEPTIQNDQWRQGIDGPEPTLHNDYWR